MDTQESKELRFSNKQILVVGEGDFSFSLSLAKAFGTPATNFTATSLDIRENLGRNYNNGKDNVDELERLGCTVVRGVNVHSITSDNRLARYDCILFYCPHAGKHNGVVGGFMKSAKEMMKDEDVGEFHIIRNTMHPFNKWDIKTLAEEEGLRYIKQMKFDKWAFPSYSNKNGNGRSNCDSISSFRFGSAVVTFMFKK